MLEKNFLGKEGFIWFFGIVEDRNDPEENKRVRVRCHGYHTDDKTKIPTEDLFWQQVMTPTTSPSVSGIGSTSFLVEGSFVFGFFADGIDQQFPIVIGTLPQIPNYKPDSQKGFNDPRTDLSGYPKKVQKRTESRDGSGQTIVEQDQTNYPSYVQESDVNRLQRNKNIEHTIVQTKKDNRIQGIVTQNGGEFSEPENPYAQKFPFNMVTETESGHITEYDDTPGAERLHMYHRAGTFREVHPNGAEVQKTVDDFFAFILKNQYEHVEGKKVVTVDKGCELFVNRDEEGEGLSIKVGQNGNFQITVESGDVVLNVNDGNLTKYVNGDVTETVTGDYNLTVQGNKKETVSGNVTQMVSGNKTESVGGNLTTIQNGVHRLVGSMIYFN